MICMNDTGMYECSRSHSLETPPEYNQDETTPSDISMLVMTFLTNLKVTENYAVSD